MQVTVKSWLCLYAATHSHDNVYEQFMATNHVAILFLDVYLDLFFVFNPNKNFPTLKVNMKSPPQCLETTKVRIYSANSFYKISKNIVNQI